MKTPSFLAAILAATFAGAGENGPPNILLLDADDLGDGDLTCYDPISKIPTPNLDRPLGGSKFKDAQFTLPEMLRDNGDATACIGKWHLG